MGVAHSPPRRGGVARQLNRSWRAGVVSSAICCAGLTTPSAPLRWLRRIILMAQPPLLCEEGNTKIRNYCTKITRYCAKPKGGRLARKALITGLTGQDGSYLAEFLLEKGYEVHGIVRRVALEDPEHRLWRIRGILDKVRLHPASLESFPSLFRVMTQVRPVEVYHLAAQSFVSYSFEDEFSTLNTNINGTHYMLAATRHAAPDARFYFAGSSEMFGEAAVSPQSEETPFHPRSAYGISKIAGFDLTRNYREAYGMHASSGILFNHESPRRGFEFVTRKITSHAARIKLGLTAELRLGNLEAKRDWGHARQYVR